MVTNICSMQIPYLGVVFCVDFLLCCLLQHTREVVLVVTMASASRPVPTAVNMVTNICSMQIPYLGVVFCVDFFLCCQLQHTREVVLVVTMAPASRPVPTAVNMVTNICSMQIPYLGVVFCVDFFLCCLLQHTREVVLVVTMAPASRPVPTAVNMVTNICSMQIPYLGVVFCVDTLHSISIFFL